MANKTENTLITYKGFNADWTCRDYQFEIGKTYDHDGDVVACSYGFHSCENPIDVLAYYLIDKNGDLAKFARTTSSGAIARHNTDTKIASAKITIDVELKLPDIIATGVKWMIDAFKTSGDGSKQAASGNYITQAASGDGSTQAASGNYSTQVASGNYSTQAASGGDSKQAASGNYSKQAASGDYSKQAASGDGSTQAASGNYSKQAASGDDSKQAASGDDSTQAASGNRSTQAASGNYSIQMIAGFNGRAKPGRDGAIAIAYHDGKRPRIAIGYVGEDGIEAGKWYAADPASGNLVEVQS